MIEPKIGEIKNQGKIMVDMELTKEQMEEFKLRSQNIFWTVQGDYAQKMPEDFWTPDRIRAKHDAVLWAAIFLYADVALIRQFLEYLAAKPDFYAAFSRILWIALEEYCMPKLYVNWPAVRELFFSYYQEIAEPTGTLSGADKIIERAYGEEKIGRLEKEDRWLKALFGDIFHCAAAASDTAELLAAVEELYGRYFREKHWSDALPIAGRRATKPLPTGYQPDESFFQKKRIHAGEEVQQVKIVDAEFNPNSYRGKASAEYLAKEREKSAGLASTGKKRKLSDREKVWQFFGDLLLPQTEVEQIEQRICSGLHRHKRLYISDGSFATVLSEYQIRFLQEQRRLNLEYLEENYHSCRRHIENLRLLLANTLLPDSQTESYRADAGRLQAGLMWRAEYLCDRSVFERQIKNEIGNFVVDLLLDGSGSQSERQAEIAFQGYIIAEALSLCAIPCRVSAYATFLDYTILRQYKDYDSPREENKKIFDFFGTGMNRDGFALRAVGERMTKRQEENKVLIVLSDGKPNDVRVFQKETKNPEIREYTGDVAVKDTAAEVRKLRFQGISVLGVFTGLETDLAAQQTIYGRDFVYSKDLSRFSKIVGAYLKKELRKFL